MADQSWDVVLVPVGTSPSWQSLEAVKLQHCSVKLWNRPPCYNRGNCFTDKTAWRELVRSTRCIHASVSVCECPYFTSKQILSSRYQPGSFQTRGIQGVSCCVWRTEWPGPVLAESCHTFISLETQTYQLYSHLHSSLMVRTRNGGADETLGVGVQRQWPVAHLSAAQTWSTISRCSHRVKAAATTNPRFGTMAFIEPEFLIWTMF